MDQTEDTNSPTTQNEVNNTDNTTGSSLPSEYTVLVERLTGTVKWFNNRAGFGFITVCEPGEYENKEIFVHWSSIRVSNSQYKYLFQGEYVDFTLVKANNNDHEYQAMNVSGVRGGPIMCETRRTSVSNGSVERVPPRFRMNRPGPGPGRGSGPPRRGGGGGEDGEDRRGRDERRSRSRPSNGGSRSSEDQSKTQNSDLLDYVKVQSKRTRRTNAGGAR